MNTPLRMAVVGLAFALLTLGFSSLLYLAYYLSDFSQSLRGQEHQRLERATVRRQEGIWQTVQEWVAQRCTLAQTMQRLQELDREFVQEWPAYNSIVLKLPPPSDEERHYHTILNYGVVVLRGRPQEVLPVVCRLNKAFAEEPKLANDVAAIYRYNIACAAALVRCGQGKDAEKLDATERARLRQQALDWLRAYLKAYRQAREKPADKFGPAFAEMMNSFRDNDFASVRDAESLGKLPEAEREDWHKFWEEVEALR